MGENIIARINDALHEGNPISHGNAEAHDGAGGRLKKSMICFADGTVATISGKRASENLPQVHFVHSSCFALQKTVSPTWDFHSRSRSVFPDQSAPQRHLFLQQARNIQNAGLAADPMPPVLKRDNHCVEDSQLPKQETFFEQRAGNVCVEVIKTYDRAYAYEVFQSMNDPSLRILAASLNINSGYQPDEIPNSDEPQYADFLWAELLEAAVEDVRLDPHSCSFFVVSKSANGESRDLYVSAD